MNEWQSGMQGVWGVMCLLVDFLDWFFLPPALDKHGKLTEPLGINMAEFPLEPMIAKMLLVSGGNCTVCLCSSYYLQKYMVWLNSKIQCFQTNGCKIKLSDLLELLKAMPCN